MSKSVKAASVKLIPIDRINILNPRVRNQKTFKDIATNIAQIGLKRPITVTPCRSGVAGKDYDLVCGQGRMEAFMACGQTKIPAIIIEATEEQALIMSLVENLARRHHSSVDLLHGIELLQKNGYDAKTIAAKTGVTADYVTAILNLKENGEERLVNAVETGQMSLGLAITIASFPDDEQRALQEAYESGELRGKRFLAAKRQIDLRRRHGKLLNMRTGRHKKGSRSEPLSKRDIMKDYQKEIDRKRLMNQKAEAASNSLAFVVTALRNLFKEDHFMTLLRAEKITDMPAPIHALIGKKGS
ncbi:MAG TPA: chromosome partitioning protein ParB [Rhodospirillaceae bacterium]|nr:chromosome partitioning protein ParB [Rhodospirillaceae bacterium]